MKTKNALFFSLLFNAVSAYSQEFIQREPQFFRTIFDGVVYANSYYIGTNPAFLKWEKSDQRLSVKTYFSESGGNFKPFFTPGKENYYQVSLAGKKQISDAQIFSGSFSFLKNERDDWAWLTTKNYNPTSPFLLGDSTTGSTRYNVMSLSARYSSIVCERFLIGAGLDFSVDEGLKKISPRPASDHRNIYFNLGVGYMLDDKTSFGFSLGLYDFNETINYSADEGAVYTETILLKFRGLDFPLRFTKKDESRYSFHNKYHLSGNFQHLSNDLKLCGTIGIGFEKITLKDGGNSPTFEGFMRNDFYSVEAKLIYNPSKNISAGFYYSFDQQSLWARHPLYNVLINEDECQMHLAGGGIQYDLDSKISMGIEVEMIFSKRKNNDYYSTVYLKGNTLEWIPKIGLSYNWSENTWSFLSYSYSINNVDDPYVSTSVQSNYYSNFTIKNTEFILAKFSTHSFYYRMELEFENVGLFSLFLSFKTERPIESKIFIDTVRNYFSTGIEYRVQVY
ncbi:MAG: DUF6850 family outer membrane beta-barrel protein [Bacteroidota bacterium]